LLKRLLKNFRYGVLPVPGRVIAIVFFIFLFIFPLIIQDTYYIDMMITATILAIFAVSWDLLAGYTGQFNFGHAVFFGVGAYTTGMLNSLLGWPMPATMIIGILAAVAVGILTCFPALRLRGPYLSLLTLAFPLMLASLVMYFAHYTGGHQGLGGLTVMAETLVEKYYICLIVMTASVLIMWKLTDAGSRYVRTGLVFHAIREDEIAARALGINTIRYKLLAFAIGGFFAGLAGVLYAHKHAYITVAVFGISLSFQAMIFVLFGGIVTIYGGIIGAYVLYPLVAFSYDVQSIIESIRSAIPPSMVPLLHIMSFLERFAIYPTAALAIVIILILLFMPEGIGVWLRHKIERECPRCKLHNVAWRKECRACSAPLR